MPSHASLKTVLWRDRLLILGGLAVLTLLAWGTMAEMAGRMHTAPAAAHLQTWGVSDFAFPTRFMDRFREDFGHARIRRLEAKHYIQEDQPGEIAAAIEDFLVEGGGSG